MDEEADLDDERATELSSIAAIFPELIYSTSNPYSATLELAITPIKPLKIRFSEPLVASSQLSTPPTSVSVEAGASGEPKPNVDIATGARDKNGRQGSNEGDVHSIEHLPRLRLGMTLPEGYPSEAPPNVSLSVSPQWLSQKKLAELETSCTTLWEDLGRDQTMYMFIDNLQQEAEDAFGMQNGEVVAFSADLQLSLLDFNLKTKREKFEKESFDCGICLEPKKGKDCHRLLMCGHVFCVACLQDFYNNCIIEGDVDNVKCMDPSCGKENGTPKKRKQHTLNPSELLTIPIEHELVQRYVRLKRKKRLESDKNVIYCPRQWCQGPSRSKKHPKPINPLEDFMSDSESETEAPPAPTKKDENESIPMSQRLCVCEDCDFAFCQVCKKSWHGELGNCIPRRRKELDEEEKATAAYLRHYSTPCPTCEAPSQKTHGCNHMICFKCNTHFCYLCSAWLSPDNPYQHFNTHGSNCYMRLWELEQGDGEGVVQREFEQWGDDTDEEDDEDEDDVDVGPLAHQNMAALANAAAQIEAIGAREAPAAPPRERAIEFVNFAQGAQQGGRRIILPNQVEEPPAAPAQAPAANNRQRQRRQNGPRQRQGNEPPPVAAPPVVVAGNARRHPAALQRFLALAQRDAEEEWDSDELDEFMSEDEDSSDDEPAPDQAVRRRNEARARRP